MNHQKSGILIAVGAVFLAIVVTTVSVATAARNASGTMTKINGPYTAGTTISSSIINNRYADIESEITDSLSRSGKGGMTAVLLGSDGTVASPAYSWTSEPGTGLYRIGAGDVGFAVSGVKKLELTSALFTVVPNATFSGTLAVTGLATVGGTLAVTGATTLTGGVAGTLAVGGVATPQDTIDSAGSYNQPINSYYASNLYYSGGWKYRANGVGAAIKMADSGNGGITLNVASLNAGGAAAAAAPVTTFTSTSALNTSSVPFTFAIGITANGGGFKHLRGVASCTTGASIGASCISTVTWGTAFADANYTATCTCGATAINFPVVVQVVSKVAASIGVAISALTAAAASCTIDCIAVHD